MKGWRQAIKYAVLQLFNQNARLPPEQNGPAERQQRAGRTISSSYIQASTSQPSKLPFHFVLFCSPVENMLSRAATGQKSTPPSIITCTITMVRMFQFTMQPTTAQTMTFHEELKKKKNKTSLLLPRRKDLNKAARHKIDLHRESMLTSWHIRVSDLQLSRNSKSGREQLQTELQFPAFQPLCLCGTTVPHQSKVYH